MKFRGLVILLLAAALLLSGCQGKKPESTIKQEQQVPPAQEPAQESVQENIGGEQAIEDLNITQDLQEIEQLLQELENLDSVQFDI